MILHEQKARILLSEMLVNKSHYIPLGYDVEALKKQAPVPDGKKPNVDDYKKFRVEVLVEHLHSSYSKAEVTVRCDYCLSEGITTDTVMTYEQYRRGESVNLTGKEACKKHKFERMKENSMIKNGVPNASMLPENVQKYKETMIKKYGVDNPQKSKEIQDKTKETLKEKYGVENLSQSEELKEKKRQTSLRNWGVEQPLSAPQVREKIQKTFEKTYGVTHVGSKGSPYRENIDSGISKAYQERGEEIQKKKEQTSIRHFKTSHPMQSEKINEKRRNTTLLIYGVPNIGSSKEMIEKRKLNNLQKWGSTAYSNSPQFLKIGYDKIVKFISEKNYILITSFEDYLKDFDPKVHVFQCQCKKCSNTFEQKFSSTFMGSNTSPHCPTCDPLPEGGSFEEDDLCNFIKSIYSGPILRNNRKILSGRREIDILLPELNIGFEYDGCKWHSELSGVDKQYHLFKQKEAEEKGISLYFIYDFEWRNSREIIKSYLRNKLSSPQETFFARKGVIQKVDLPRAKDFLASSHYQGEDSIDSHTLSLGLFFEGDLVSLLCMGKPRFNKEFEWEIIRYTNKLNIKVLGGFSKLYSYFEKNFNPKSVITYANKRLFTGKVYLHSGFQFSHNSDPGYFYIKNGYPVGSRYKFQKHKLQSLLPNFDPSLSEWENMKANGYDRVWDCGNSVYTKQYP